MKIALVINELNIRGGTHKQLLRLASYLIGNGHEVKIFTKFYDLTLSFPESAGMDVISYEKYFVSDTNTISDKLKRLYGYLRMAKDIASFSNIVNIHDNGYALMQLVFWARYPKINVIWQINDLPVYFQLGNLTGAEVRSSDSIARKLYKKVAEKAKFITVNVTKNAERIKTHYDVIAKVVYCGVDLKNDKLQILPTKTKKAKLQLISIGVFFPYRNYETFLKVIAYINVELKVDCSGVIIGSTALDPAYAKKVNDMISEHQIDCKVLGNVSEEELNTNFRESDFFLFLNKDQSWGLVVFEAMNMGIPVILSESVGATEILENKKHAVIIDPTDHKKIAEKILSLADHNEVKNEMITNAFDHTKSMTWDNMYSSKIEELMRSL